MPILILTLALPGLPPAGPELLGVWRCAGCAGVVSDLVQGGALPGRARPGLLVIFSNRCY